MTWRDREGWINLVICDNGRVVDEKERDGGWWWDQSGGYEGIREIRGTTFLIGFRRPSIGDITPRIGTHTYCIGDGKLTRPQNSLKSQYLTLISPIPYHISLSCPQLYHHLRTQSEVIALYFSMPWSRVYTEWSIQWVLHTPSTAYTECSINWVLHSPRTAWSHDRLSPAPS